MNIFFFIRGNSTVDESRAEISHWTEWRPNPPPGEKRFGKPAFNGKSTFNKDKHCDKIDKDPTLKAFLSAFVAFTTDYIPDSQEVSEATNNNNFEEDDESNDDGLRAFLGMVGSLKE